ncbi:MAG TPA: S41 family peptidase [Longimicrobium sp.]|jgi:carboxyl-terminal processing protease|uniref:S41 family peptidase n=1 Tax=Longimicrobium sp. TaxID=2029185 RepID=UPI002EDA6CB3
MPMFSRPPLRALLLAASCSAFASVPVAAQAAGNWELRIDGRSAWPVLVAFGGGAGNSMHAAALTGEGTVRIREATRAGDGLNATVALGRREYRLRATVRGDSLTGMLTGAADSMAVRGVRIPARALAPIRGAAVFDSVTRALQNVFYDPGMNGANWPALVARLRPRAAAARSDAEAFTAINELLDSLHSSHLAFSAQPAMGAAPSAPSAPASPAVARPAAVSWRVLSPSLGYLRIQSFVPTGQAALPDFARLDSAFREMGSLPGLIIDLRGNGGGSLDLAARLGQHLIARPTAAGYFVTRTGFTSRGMRAAGALDPATVRPLSTSTTGATLRASVDAGGGAGMVYVGGGMGSPFAGRIAILTDGRTGSAAEAFGAALREVRGAMVVGERSAGAMLSAEEMAIAPGWVLRYPAMDFRTPSGRRVEVVGVQVDVPSPAAGEAPIRAAAQALGHPLP